MCLYDKRKPPSHYDAGRNQPGAEILPVKVSNVHLRLELQQTESIPRK